MARIQPLASSEVVLWTYPPLGFSLILHLFFFNGPVSALGFVCVLAPKCRLVPASCSMAGCGAIIGQWENDLSPKLHVQKFSSHVSNM